MKAVCREENGFYAKGEIVEYTLHHCGFYTIDSDVLKKQWDRKSFLNYFVCQRYTPQYYDYMVATWGK